MIAKRTTLKKRMLRGIELWLRDFYNHPGAGAPPLLGNEGNVHLDGFLCKAGPTNIIAPDGWIVRKTINGRRGPRTRNYVRPNAGPECR